MPRTSCIRKGKSDAVRSKVFSKLAREITVAAKLGVPDPSLNARLRLAVTTARAQSMPRDNIERAIKKAIGSDGENYEAIRYEGYGPGGIALVVETLTDNRNRTASNVRSTLSKNGGALGETNSVGFMFDHVGEIHYPVSAGSADKVMEAAIDAGADDVESDEDGHWIYTSFEAHGRSRRCSGKGAGRSGIGQGNLASAEHHYSRCRKGRVGDAS